MAPTGKPRSWLEELADLEDPAPRDFDPERHDQHGAADESEDSIDEDAGRDHYQRVEYIARSLEDEGRLTSHRKSTLRTHDDPELGPQYTGASVGRAALKENGDGNDSAGESSGLSGVDSELDEVDEEEDPTTSGVKLNGLVNGGNTTREQVEENDSDFSGFESNPSSSQKLNGHLSSASDLDDDTDPSEEETDPSDEDEAPDSETERATLRNLMSTSTASVTSSLKRAAATDLLKGRAIKRQRSTFDSLLSTRIKLQKSLTASHSLPSPSSEIDTTQIQKAEQAALTLLTNLLALHSSLPNQSSPPTSTTTSSLSSHLQALHNKALPSHRQTLNKWAARTAPPSLTNSKPSTSKFSSQSTQPSLSNMLDSHLSGLQLEKHIAKSRLPAPTSSSSTTSPPTEIQNTYNDTDFYSTLLRDLVAQRGSQTLSSAANGGPAVPLPDRRETRVRKMVDRKASKGRKMRYTVHEKLVSFMVADDAGAWGDRQRKELFAGLLGQKPQHENEDGEGDGIRLFG